MYSQISIILFDHHIEKINTPVDTSILKRHIKFLSKKLNLPIDKNLILFVAKGGLEN